MDRFDRTRWLLPFGVLLVMSTLLLLANAPSAAQNRNRVSPCVLLNNKWADPTDLMLGDWTTVTLTSTTECPKQLLPLHIVLSIDGSLSMNPQGKLDQAKRAAKQFVLELDMDVSKVGVTSFSDKAYTETDLTDSRGRILGAIEGIDTELGTVIADGLDLSREILIRGRNAQRDEELPDPVEVVLILSDGRPWFNTPAEVRQAAAKIKAAGMLLISVCVGNDCDVPLMRSIASRSNLFFDVRQASRLVAVFLGIVEDLLDTQLRVITVRDVVPDNMKYIEGSGVPPPERIVDNVLFFRWDVVPSDGITITYQLEPLEVGTHPTNVEALAEFRDNENRMGEKYFPIPTVHVIAPPTPTPTTTPTNTPTPGPSPTNTPTTTPTPTDTPTPTNTPTPSDIYLPLALREQCDPVIEATDVVLLIDISSSMAWPTRDGDLPKRRAAARAARAFATMAQGPGDQVAVVVFDAEARVLAPLGSDAAAVEQALSRLPRGEGTAIDAGLRRALAEITGPARRPANEAAILLLTDGIPTRSTFASVRESAREVREAGIQLFAVGLGADVDADLLRELAGDARRYVAAPRAEDLESIYRRLARLIPCPTGRHDWARPWP